VRRTRTLSARDERKPVVLIAAAIVGLGTNRATDGSLTEFDWIVRIGLFGVIFAVMAFVEIGAVGHAFRKGKPTAIAVTTNFVVVPAFAWALGWMVLRDFPDLWAGVILYTLTPCVGWYLIFIDLAHGNADWGLAMLPIDVVLQIVLLPIYLSVLIGTVVPIDTMTVVRSVGGFLVVPSVAAAVTRRLLVRWKGREFTYGSYKHAIDEVKLWALVAVVVGVFATQPRLANTDLARVGLIIATISLFFLGIFAIALAIGRAFRLGYADTTAMVFELTARNSESVVGVAAVAFAGRPLVMLAIVVGPIVELPALLGLSRVMLQLRTRWRWADIESAHLSRV
jgi:ACR3 family arsenite efflux pump ArsB